MAKYFMGSEILNRYLGNYILATSGNEIVSVIGMNGIPVEPGNRVLHVGKYIVLVEPNEGYLFGSLTVNGESIPNGSEITINFGDHLDVYSYTTVDPDNGLGGRDPGIFDNEATPDIGDGSIELPDLEEEWT